MTRRRVSPEGGWLRTASRAAVVVIALLVAAAAYLSGQRPGPEPPPATVAPPSASALMRAYFTTPALRYPDQKDRRPPSPLLDALIADVESARLQVDIAVFDFDLRPLADALIAAKGRGVRVRMVIDGENLSDAAVSAEAGRMQEAGIPITFDRREAFMHDKFAVIDRRIVWLGSWNMTENDTFRNNNNALRLRSQLAAQAYAQEFEQLFGGAFGTRKAVVPHKQILLDTAPLDIYFSPTDGVARHVLAEIGRAKKRIRFMAFSFTSAPIAQAMIERAAAGVDVRGVMEAQNAAGAGAVFGALRDAGVDVVQDGSCYILHHKVILIDDQIVITGSYNFTSSAERDNDENLVIISDPQLAAAYRDEFERIAALAKAPTRCG